MRYVLIMAILFTLGCDKGKTPPATTAAQTTTAEPQSDVDVLPPDKQLLAYYTAMTEARYEDAYAMVHAADQQAKSFPEFKRAVSDPLQEELLKHRSYEIKDVIIDGKKARVEVDTTGPNVAAAQKEIVPQLKAKLAEIQQIPSADMLKQALRQALESGRVPSMVTNNTLFLTQDDAGVWKLDFDWDAEHPGRTVPMKSKRDAGN